MLIEKDDIEITCPGAQFPAGEIESCLMAELTEAARAEAEIREIDFPMMAVDQHALQISIDSLVVVELLVELEPILGFELKSGLVNEGGYTSVNSAKSHLLPRIQQAWQKQQANQS